jgi:hypothetical protein
VEHAVIDRATSRLMERGPVAQPARRGDRRSRVRDFGHSTAATRFAEACAAIGGTTVLHDLMPDVVTVSFGSRTSEILNRLHARGWDFVGFGEWRGEPVLGVSFAGDRRARITTEELIDALVLVIGEIEIEESRLW